MPQFNAAKHLKYAAPSKRYTMTELGLDPASRMNENSAPAVIDFAVTEAFPLISPAGVQVAAEPSKSGAVRLGIQYPSIHKQHCFAIGDRLDSLVCYF